MTTAHALTIPVQPLSFESPTAAAAPATPAAACREGRRHQPQRQQQHAQHTYDTVAAHKPNTNTATNTTTTTSTPTTDATQRQRNDDLTETRTHPASPTTVATTPVKLEYECCCREKPPASVSVPPPAAAAAGLAAAPSVPSGIDLSSRLFLQPSRQQQSTASLPSSKTPLPTDMTVATAAATTATATPALPSSSLRSPSIRPVFSGPERTARTNETASSAQSSPSSSSSSDATTTHAAANATAADATATHANAASTSVPANATHSGCTNDFYSSYELSAAPSSLQAPTRTKLLFRESSIHREKVPCDQHTHKNNPVPPLRHTLPTADNRTSIQVPRHSPPRQSTTDTLSTAPRKPKTARRVCGLWNPIVIVHDHPHNRHLGQHDAVLDPATTAVASTNHNNNHNHNNRDNLFNVLSEHTLSHIIDFLPFLERFRFARTCQRHSAVVHGLKQHWTHVDATDVLQHLHRYYTNKNKQSDNKAQSQSQSHSRRSKARTHKPIAEKVGQHLDRLLNPHFSHIVSLTVRDIGTKLSAHSWLPKVAHLQQLTLTDFRDLTDTHLHVMCVSSSSSSPGTAVSANRDNANSDNSTKQGTVAGGSGSVSVSVSNNNNNNNNANINHHAIMRGKPLVLQQLTLSHCPLLSNLASVARYCPNLQRLSLQGCSNIRSIASVQSLFGTATPRFPSLAAAASTTGSARLPPSVSAPRSSLTGLFGEAPSLPNADKNNSNNSSSSSTLRSLFGGPPSSHHSAAQSGLSSMFDKPTPLRTESKPGTLSALFSGPSSNHGNNGGLGSLFQGPPSSTAKTRTTTVAASGNSLSGLFSGPAVDVPKPEAGSRGLGSLFVPPSTGRTERRTSNGSAASLSSLFQARPQQSDATCNDNGTSDDKPVKENGRLSSLFQGPPKSSLQTTCDAPTTPSTRRYDSNSLESLFAPPGMSPTVLGDDGSRRRPTTRLYRRSSSSVVGPSGLREIDLRGTGVTVAQFCDDIGRRSVALTTLRIGGSRDELERLSSVAPGLEELEILPGIVDSSEALSYFDGLTVLNGRHVSSTTTTTAAVTE